MFGFFKKKITEVVHDCMDCKYCGIWESPDKLNPDKTVTKGKIEAVWCGKGNFYLEDYKPCELFEVLGVGDHRPARMAPLGPRITGPIERK